MHIKRFINIHTILLLVFVITVLGVAYRFLNWGRLVDLDAIMADDTEARPDTMDLILPALDQDHNPIVDKDDTTTIVCFGNAPFADDRDSKNNLANLIAQKTGATVYNCSVNGSYLAAQNYTIDAGAFPMDVYNFYWLTQVAVKSTTVGRYKVANKAMGEDAPPEGIEVFETLYDLDFNDVDVIAIMYDASDYLAGHEMYNDYNHTDIEQFTGNLEAGVELLQSAYPHLRFIVMSPTYAFAVDEEGNYVSSDIYTYGQDVLSTYAIKQSDSCFDRSITYIDNLYGTIHEDNASEYLIDNLHLNQAGRELVADRFIDALYYYNR